MYDKLKLLFSNQREPQFGSSIKEILNIYSNRRGDLIFVVKQMVQISHNENNLNVSICEQAG
jgi:hypothetical protein